MTKVKDGLPKTGLDALMRASGWSDIGLVRELNKRGYDVRQPALSRLRRGQTSRPQLPLTTALEEFFGIPARALLDRDQIPDHLLRKMSHPAYDLGNIPTGLVELSQNRYNSLSGLHDTSIHDISPRKVPVKTQVEFSKSGWAGAMSAIGTVSHFAQDAKAYAVRVSGVALAPRYKHGEYLIVEPSIEPRSGDEVIVTHRDGTVMVQEWLYARDDLTHFIGISGEGKIAIPTMDVVSIHRITGRASADDFSPQTLPPPIVD